MNWSREWKLWCRFSDQGKFRQLLLNPTKTGERVRIFKRISAMYRTPLQYQKPTMNLKLHMSIWYLRLTLYTCLTKLCKSLVKSPSFTSLVPKVSHGQASLSHGLLQELSDLEVETQWFWKSPKDTVDGSEIRRSPIDSLFISWFTKVLYMPGGCWGFLNHQQYYI